MLGDLENKTRGASSDGDLKGVKDRGQGAVELNIYDGTDDLCDNATLLNE